MRAKFLNQIYLLLMIVFTVTVAGCYQGRPSSKPPIHLNPNMDMQNKYKPQGRGEFFADGSAMRQPVAGTVARGQLNEDDSYYRGKNSGTDSFIRKSPVEMTKEGLERGRERFNIYCSVCHGEVGDSKSIMVQKGYIPPPTLHSDLIRNYPDGQLFDVISNGIRNMPSYRQQIPVKDRWLIVNYLRTLQRSQYTTIEDIPVDKRESLKAGG